MKPLHVRQRERRPSSKAVEDTKRRAAVGQAITETVDAAIAAIPPPPPPVPIGVVMEFAGATPPAAWLLCDGATVLKADYPDLYAVIGDVFANGTETGLQFSLPDHRGRAAIGAGQGLSLTNRPLGQKVGAETHTLTETEIAVHDHDTFFDTASNTESSSSGNATRVQGGGNDISIETNSAGGGGAHNNMPPVIALNFIIRATA